MKDSNKYYIYMGSVILLMALVIFLAFAVGGLRVCNDLEGHYNDRLECSLDHNTTLQFNNPYQELLYKIENEKISFYVNVSDG